MNSFAYYNDKNKYVFADTVHSNTNKYVLVNIETGVRSRKSVELSEAEVNVLNYAYALNNSELEYQLINNI